MPIKLTLEYVKGIISSKNGTLLSKKYINNKQNLNIKCNKCNCVWDARFDNIKNGSWCPDCSKKHVRKQISLSFDQVKKTINDKGGELLSDHYANNRSKIKIRCCKGHVWEAIFKEIRNNCWCPHCAGNVKKDVGDLDALLAKINARRLEDEIINTHTPVEVECNRCGCVWKPTYGSLRNGHGCPDCAMENIKHSYDFIASQIEERGGLLLSNTYVNSYTYMSVQCNKCNNIWDVKYSSIHAGHWCPHCARGKTQNLLSEIIQKLYPDYIVENNFRGFEWLKNKKTGKLQEIDIWVPKIKLAIEYDGAQHFMPVNFSKCKKEAEKKFKYTKAMDRLKNKLISKHPEYVKYFIRFNYREKITPEYVRQKLKKAGLLKGD